jgi:hypothetical protein
LSEVNCCGAKFGFSPWALAGPATFTMAIKRRQCRKLFCASQRQTGRATSLLM